MILLLSHVASFVKNKFIIYKKTFNL